MRIPVASDHRFRCKTDHLFQSNLAQPYPCERVLRGGFGDPPVFLGPAAERDYKIIGPGLIFSR
jgi:hypothetical protein